MTLGNFRAGRSISLLKKVSKETLIWTDKTWYATNLFYNTNLIDLIPAFEKVPQSLPEIKFNTAEA